MVSSPRASIPAAILPASFSLKPTCIAINFFGKYSEMKRRRKKATI
jgi:hypothetical protein